MKWISDSNGKSSRLMKPECTSSFCVTDARRFSTLFVIWGFVLLLSLAGCGGGPSNEQSQSAPAPAGADHEFRGEPTELRAVAALDANPLEGGFTAEERASVMALRGALLASLDLAIAECGVAGTETACGFLLQAAYEFGQSVGWLLHVNVNPVDRDGARLLASPRPAVLAEAWEDLDRGVFELERARAFREHPLKLQAIAQAKAVDRALAYATPWPVFPVSGLGTNPQNQFGPHGLYSAAQKDLWLGLQYMPEGLQSWYAGQKAGVLPVGSRMGSEGLIGPTQSWARAVRLAYGEVLFLSAGVISDESYAAYRTAAEESLPESPRKALTEIHMVQGPTDAIRFASVERHIASAMALSAERYSRFPLSPASAPFLATYHEKLQDSWKGMVDEWGGHFNGIF